MHTYNYKTMWEGWKNYQSWVTNLWLENDKGLYRAALAMRRGTRDKFEYADRIKEFVLDLLDYELKGLKEDLLDYSIEQIDWVEVAENWIENYFQEENEDEEDE